MEGLKDFNEQNDLGIKPQEWSKEHTNTVQAFIQQHYEDTSPTEKLQHRLFAIKLEMETYLAAKDITEIKPAGLFVLEAIMACKQLLNIPKKAIAEHWETTTANLSKYLKGERSFGIELAFKINSTLKIPAQLLLSIEIKNEILKKEKYYKDSFSFNELIHA